MVDASRRHRAAPSGACCNCTDCCAIKIYVTPPTRTDSGSKRMWLMPCAVVASVAASAAHGQRGGRGTFGAEWSCKPLYNAVMCHALQNCQIMSFLQRKLSGWHMASAAARRAARGQRLSLPRRAQPYPPPLSALVHKPRFQHSSVSRNQHFMCGVVCQVFLSCPFSGNWCCIQYGSTQGLVKT